MESFNEKKNEAAAERVNAYYELGKKAVANEPKKGKPDAKTADLIYALICIAVGTAVAYMILWSGIGLGLSVCAALIGAVTLLYVKRDSAKISAYAVFSIVLYVLLGAGFSFCDSVFCKILAFAAMLVTYTVAVLDARGMRTFAAGTYRSVRDVVYCSIVLPAVGFGKTLFALTHIGEGKNGKLKKALGAFTGALLAVPALCIIIPLLVSSDAAFEAVLSGFTFKSVWNLIWAFVIGGFGALLWFAQLFCSKTERCENARTEERKKIESITLISFLSVISIVYIVYLLSQSAYFVGGFSGILPEGFTAANYARRGFFELCIICAINLLIIFGVWVLERRENAKAHGVLRGLCVFLCAFSKLLCVISLSKMFMYIDRFGLTRLRIYTSVFMVLLFFVFIAVTVRLFVKGFPYMKVAVVTAAVLAMALCYFEADGMVARYNVRAYLSGKADSVDVRAIAELPSDAAVPYLFELLDDERYEKDVKIALSERAEEHFIIMYSKENGETSISISDSSYDMMSYNLYDYKAHKLLLEHFSEYFVDTRVHFDID